MQPQSMTGYGRGATGNFTIEARSSNHKNLDIQINMPSYLHCFEVDIKRLVKQKFQRGRIEITILRQVENAVKVRVNKSLAREFYTALVSLRDELSIPENIGIDVLASRRDIFLLEETETKIDDLYGALAVALEELKKMRIEEGKNLINDIINRIKLLYKYIIHIENKRTEVIANTKKRLYERLKELLGDTAIDDTRLIQETAVLIERSDITEELVRIKSHMEYIEKTLNSGDTIGKKMDFLVQELRREMNTINSKKPDTKISTCVVEMKHELEKIREQVQNLQ